jgi:hypothetical protein
VPSSRIPGTKVFTRQAALYRDNPPVDVGDQGFRTGLESTVAFRVGPNWFDVDVRLALPNGDFDHTRSFQLAMRLAQLLAPGLRG